jgi:hypothetical protein
MQNAESIRDRLGGPAIRSSIARAHDDTRAELTSNRPAVVEARARHGIELPSLRNALRTPGTSKTCHGNFPETRRAIGAYSEAVADCRACDSRGLHVDRQGLGAHVRPPLPDATTILPAVAKQLALLGHAILVAESTPVGRG